MDQSAWSLSPLVNLLLTTVGLAAGTFICGLIPLSLPLSKTMLRILEVLGAGLLVGASMTVVLPEGVGEIFRASQEAAGAHKVIPTTRSWAWSGLKRSVDDHDHDHDHHEGSAGFDPEAITGYSLLAGFLIMFLLDQIAAPGSHTHQSEPVPRQASIHPSHRPETLRLTRASSIHIPKEYQKQRRREDSADPHATLESSPELMATDHDLESSASPLLRNPPLNGTRHTRKPSTGSIDRDGSIARKRGLRTAFASIAGLVIHAVADGIAMGASAGSGDESLKLIVFFAIMIHKAPASFGLCTLLMGQKLMRSDIRKAIAIFSLATPFGAILTYLFLTLLTGHSNESGVGNVSEKHIGAALTFSGGTFIFVAMHAVHELASAGADTEQADDTEDHHHASAPNSPAFQPHQQHGQPVRQILGRTGRISILLIGTVLPRMMQGLVGHHH